MRDPAPILAVPDALATGADLADPHARAHALVERQQAVLTRLAEIGMDIAEAAREMALAQVQAAVSASGSLEAGAPALPARADPGLIYSRVARALRLTLMLQTRLLKDLPALGRAEALTRSDQENARRNRAHRLALRAIRDEHDNAETVEALSDEVWERLREEDLSDDVSGRPLGEVVARICRDLGLSPDWTAWAMAAATAAPAPPETPPPDTATAPVRLMRPQDGPMGGSRLHPTPDDPAGPPPHAPRLSSGAHGAPPGCGQGAAP